MNGRSGLGEFERFVLLSINRLGAGAYGTPIIQEIELLSGKEPTLGAVYTTLKRLELKNLITSSLAEATPERGGRAKRYFRLSAQGEMALRKSLETRQRLSSSLVSAEVL